MVLIALVRGIVGSVSILSYMESCERWFSPSLTYCSVSSMTMPEPLSALLIAITPLHAASGNGHKDAVQVMLRNITNFTHIDCVDMYGR